MADKADNATEYVVITDKITYRHPESNPLPGQPHQVVEADRGALLSTKENEDDINALPKISLREAKRGVALGALSADKNSLEARLSLAGHRPDDRLGAPYASLTSGVEQRRAAVAVAQMMGGSGPQSSRSDLTRLAVGDLQRLAQAFGAPEDIFSQEDKDALINWLKGDYDEAEEPGTHAENIEQRDQVQLASRELPGHGTGDVVARRVEAEQAADQDTSKRSRRKSAAAKKTGGDSGDSGDSGQS